MELGNFYNSKIIDKAYTAKKLLDNAYLIMEQAKSVYIQRGMVFPVICSSTLVCLKTGGFTSVTEIAKEIGHPHQTVAQHLRALSKLDILDKRTDKKDLRRTEYYLTALGHEQAELLNKYNIEAASVFRGLDADIGIDLGATLDAAYDQLTRKTLSDRFSSLEDVHVKDNF